MTRSIVRRAVVIGAVSALVLGACGDDDDGADTTTPASAASAPAATTETPATDAPAATTEAAPADTQAPPADTAAPTDDTAAPTDTPYVEEDDGYGAPSTDAPAATVGATSPPAAAGSALTIVDSAFSESTASAGVEFMIANEDDYGHTVTDRNGSFDVELGGSSSEPLTIDRPGEYEIFCRIHEFMTGTITVV